MMGWGSGRGRAFGGEAKGGIGLVILFFGFIIIGTWGGIGLMALLYFLGFGLWGVLFGLLWFLYWFLSIFTMFGRQKMLFA